MGDHFRRHSALILMSASCFRLRTRGHKAFAGGHGEGQPILAGRYWTGCELCEGARWRIGAIEIDHDTTSCIRFRHVEKSARWVGCVARRQIAEKYEVLV